jgi:hypothetical protein
MERLACFAPAVPGRLFSSRNFPVWTSRIFWEHFAWPLLELMRQHGEPALQIFTDAPGQQIQDQVWSLHSWRWAGRYRVSRNPRHDEPNPRGTWKATKIETYEHERWEATKNMRSEEMTAHYNQWELIDRLAITSCCM